MKARQILLGAAVAAGLGLTSMASAATITTSLGVLNAAGNPVSVGADGKYHFNVGDTFHVVLQATLTNPNTVSSQRASTVAGLPLGIQTMNANIVSGGAGQIQPVAKALNPDTTKPLQWIDSRYMDPVTLEATKYLDLTPGTDVANGVPGLGFDFINAIDIGNDGDLDPAGAGFINQSTTLAAIGVSRAKESVGLPGYTNILAGDYKAMANGETTLFTDVTKAVIYSDPNGTGALVGQDFALSGVTNGSITIQVGAVPEPASIGMLGLGALGLLARRRRA